MKDQYVDFTLPLLIYSNINVASMKTENITFILREGLVIIWVVIEVNVNVEEIPWGPSNSFHPWSLVLIVRILKKVRGLVIIFVEIGVIYHIFIKISFLSDEGKYKVIRVLGEFRERIIAPVIVTARARSFREKGKGSWKEGLISIQFIKAPEKIAPDVIIIIGVV